MINPLVAVFAIAPALALLQAVPELGWAPQAEHLGLVTGLSIAASVLWKQLGKKDEQLGKKDESINRKDEVITQMVQRVTEAMIAQSNNMAEFRRVLDESVKAKQELKASIDLLEATLGNLPCTMELRR